MKPGIQMLVTVLLVAGGIFVYDTLAVRSVERPIEVIERASSESALEAGEAPHVEDVDAVPSFPLLEGTGDDLWRSDVERRLATLETHEPGLVQSGGALGALPIPGVDVADEAGEVTDAEDLDPEEKRRLQRERFQRFRKMLEAVERTRRWEQAARKVKQYFDGLDLSLTDEEKSRAVRTTVHFQNRWKQSVRGPANTEEQKQARRDAYQTLWNEYATMLQEQIPAAEADVILDSIQQAAAGRKDGGR